MQPIMPHSPTPSVATTRSTPWIRRVSVSMDRENGPRKVSQSPRLQEAAITSRTQTVLSPISTTPTQRLSASGSTSASSSSLHSHKETPNPNHASAPRPHSLLNVSPALNTKKERPTSYYSYFSSPTWVSSDVPSMLNSDGVAVSRPRPFSMVSALEQKPHLPGTFTSQSTGPVSQAMISHSRNASLDELPMSSAVEEATSSSSAPRISSDISARNIPLSVPVNRAPLSFVVDNDLADDLVASWARGEFQDVPSNEIASVFLKKSYSRSATPSPGNYHYQKRCTSSMSFHPEVLALSGAGSELRRMSVELQPETETEESESDSSVAGRNIMIGTEEGSGLCLSSAFLADVVSLNGDLNNDDDDDDGTYIELECDTTTDTSGPFSPSSSQFRSTWSSRSSAASTPPPTSPIDPIHLQTHIRTYGDEFPPLFRGLDSLSNLHFEDGKTTLITPFVSPTAFINPRPAPKPPVIVDPPPEASALRAIFVFGQRGPSTRAAPSRTPTITKRDRANSTASTLRRFNSLKGRPKKTVVVDESGVQVQGHHQPRFGGSMMNLNMLLRGENQSFAESLNNENASKKHSFLSRLKHGLGWKTHSKGRSV